MHRHTLLLLLLTTLTYCQDAVNQEMLRLHNKYRKMHGAPPMTYDSASAKLAQGWAENLANTNTFSHRPSSQRGGRGENIAYSSNGSNKSMFMMWYDEVKDWDFAQGRSRGGVTGHFTQVVWKATTKLGCGLSKGRLVCNYMPAGNFSGRYKQNVLPKGGKTDDKGDDKTDDKRDDSRDDKRDDRDKWRDNWW